MRQLWRGARVIATAGPANQDYLVSLGATATQASGVSAAPSGRNARWLGMLNRTSPAPHRVISDAAGTTKGDRLVQALRDLYDIES